MRQIEEGAKSVLLAVLFVLVVGAPVNAQCLPLTDQAEGLFEYAKELGKESGEFWVDIRNTHNIPQVSEEDVEIVTVTSVCKSAGREYKKSFDLTGKAPEVHVIRIGTRYIVMNPETLRGEFTMYLVLDLEFNEVSSWGG